MNLCLRATVLVTLALAASACTSSSNNPTQPQTPRVNLFANPQAGKRPLDPELMQQFANPLPLIPARTPDTTRVPGSDYYVVKAIQGEHDFGLRKMDGTKFKDPATAKDIETLSWGYDISYLGPTIEARTGRPVVVHYVNALVDGAGQPLQQHLFYVDRTVDGVEGNPLVRIVPHLHGGHVAAQYDGHPLHWFTADPGAPANGMGGPAGNSVDYTYANDQAASTIWFHDHALGVTRLNVYAGLAAFYLIRDAHEDALDLPSGKYEVPLVLQDKSFNDDGSLAYRTLPLINPYTGLQMVDELGNPMYSSGPEFFGNTIIVNGVAWPVLDVEPRKYRFRMVNGADSRFFNLWLELPGRGPFPGLNMVQIGAEQGLLPDAVALGDGPGPSGLLLANGERADVVVDFAAFAGSTIVMRNDAAAPYPFGDGPDANTTGKVMAFRVAATVTAADTSQLPAHPLAVTPLPAPANTRVVDLQELTDIYEIFDDEASAIGRRLELRLNGLRFMDPVTENIALNDVEDWTIINTTGDMHPMHLHLVAFEVKERGWFEANQYTPAAGGNMGVLASPSALHPDAAPPECISTPGCDASQYRLAANEEGLKDTVKVPPGGYVRIRARFDRPGEYMWHCHILAHEEHDMMRPFVVQ